MNGQCATWIFKFNSAAADMAAAPCEPSVYKLRGARVAS
jgi:hypothetical protein